MLHRGLYPKIHRYQLHSRWFHYMNKQLYFQFHNQ